jgi:hypothetical protein
VSTNDLTQVNFVEQARRQEDLSRHLNSMSINEDADSSLNRSLVTEKSVAASQRQLAKPTANISSQAIAEAFKKMTEIRKFKRPVEMDKELMDGEGYGHVVITGIDGQVADTIVYNAMPLEVRDSYKAYKIALNEAYSGNHPEIPIEELAQFKRHMIIAKIDNDWVRGNVLNISMADKVFSVEDIDTGRKGVVTNYVVKVPLEAEMHKAPYSFKIVLENLTNGETLEVGDIVKIRIAQSNPFSYSWAQIKTSNVPSPDSSKASKVVGPITVDQIEPIGMSCGPQVKVLYIDGCRLGKGLLYLTESKPEHFDFYDKLMKEIEEFMAKNPPMGYRPQPRDMVLAKFNDGCFYRACCIETDDDTAKLFYIDYGSTYSPKFSEMMELPEQFKYPCYLNTCKVKIASGKPWDNVDPKATNEKLMAKNEFVVKAEKDGSKYTITLDDSLIVFKK